MSPTTARADDRRTPRHDEILAEFAGRDLPRHLALFYADTSVQLRTVGGFVTASLREGRRCLYLADANEVSEVRAALGAAGIDVAAREEAGDLEVRDASDVYIDGGFDPDRTVERLAAAAEDAVEAGYEGVAVAGENTWCFHAQMEFEEVIEFETGFDARAPDLPVVALCQYDVRRFDEGSLAQALRVHEQVVYRGTVCENPYHVPPTEGPDVADTRANVRMMLDRTHDLARSRRDVERREQRLAVVSRVLRHNVRNDLNTILGNLSLLREAVPVEGAARERLDTAERIAERMVETAEKARYVQRTVADPAVEPAEVDAIVAEAVARTTADHPTAEIAVSGATDATVLADRRIDVALEEALANAVVHQDDDPPSVDVGVSRTDTHVTITISNPGPRIPRADREVFRRGEETRLTHGSGLGLWLVKWVVENARGRVRFPDSEGGTDPSDDAPTRLSIDLVAAGESGGSDGGRGPAPTDGG
ncbi:MAG: MEDS domain-containing protein [Haloferacaceae archaeon]